MKPSSLHALQELGLKFIDEITLNSHQKTGIEKATYLQTEQYCRLKASNFNLVQL